MVCVSRRGDGPYFRPGIPQTAVPRAKPRPVVTQRIDGQRLYHIVNGSIASDRTAVRHTTNAPNKNPQERKTEMERTPLALRVLPSYSPAEEKFNMISHIVGGGFSVIATALCIVFAAIRSDAWAVVSAAVYGVSMMTLYVMSSIYHGLPARLLGKRVFQVMDHCAVFLLIAGSYTPYCLCTLRRASPALGWVYFGIVWGLTVLAITLNAIDLKRYEVFSNIATLLLGWCIIVQAPTVIREIGQAGFLLLLSGGIAYSAGAVLYVLGARRRGFHAVFHLFVLVGSILQFFSIFFFVL